MKKWIGIITFIFTFGVSFNKCSSDDTSCIETYTYEGGNVVTFCRTSTEESCPDFDGTSGDAHLKYSFSDEETCEERGYTKECRPAKGSSDPNVVDYNYWVKPDTSCDAKTSAN